MRIPTGTRKSSRNSSVLTETSNWQSSANSDRWDAGRLGVRSRHPDSPAMRLITEAWVRLFAAALR